MTELMLHIGHGKTGSSFIQSVLSHNYEKLFKEGILYPRHANFDKAKKGRVTTGNGTLILGSSLDCLGSQKILLSSEILFGDVQQEYFCREKIESQFDKVTIVLYTRNVMEFLISAWGQHVKRNGVRLSLNSYLKQTYHKIDWSNSHHFGILNIVKIANQFNYKLVIRNYSNHRDHLIDDFTSVVNDIFGKNLYLDSTDVIVNRSLTPYEYQLIRRLNFIHPMLGFYASDSLVNMLPNIKPESPSIERDLFLELKIKHQPILEEINQFMDGNESVYFGGENEFQFV